MNRVFIVLCLLVMPLVHAVDNVPIQTLDDLLRDVRDQSRLGSAVNQVREKKFLAAADQQKKLLNEAKKALKVEQDRGKKLQGLFDENERNLNELDEKLATDSASLGELFGVVRQVANDTTSLLNSSLVSSQYPGRSVLTEQLADSDALPSIGELEKLWILLLEEMTESGKVVTFNAPVITREGTEQDKQVTRIGVFNSLSNGLYLKYLPETQRLVELSRQPINRYQEKAHAFEQAQQAYAPVGVDPSRGAILAALVQAPNVVERIQQGGIVAYVILGIGGLGLLLILERLFYLGWMGLKIKRQLKSKTIKSSNPLGRILAACDQYTGGDTETLQLKLDEAILKEMPRIERGLASIAILAAIAPLLGLLGTVTGMIETFQAITLFGTGDPKYMSSGISQALVTTELGLIVAVPIILMHSYLTGKGNKLTHILDERSAAMVARMAEQRSHRELS